MAESPAPPNLPPPGWYSDPEMVDTQRYWDGANWTEHRAPGKPATAAKSESGLVAAGWIGAILLPLAGLVIGIILVSRDEGDSGWPIIIASLLVSALGTLLIFAAWGA